MNLQKTITTVAGVLLFAATLMGQQVKTDYDRGADFARERRIEWRRQYDIRGEIDSDD